jgi:hypothetical protein
MGIIIIISSVGICSNLELIFNSVFTTFMIALDFPHTFLLIIIKKIGTNLKKKKKTNYQHSFSA